MFFVLSFLFLFRENKNLEAVSARENETMLCYSQNREKVVATRIVTQPIPAVLSRTCRRNFRKKVVNSLKS